MKNSEQPVYPCKEEAPLKIPYTYNKGLPNEFKGEKIMGFGEELHLGLTKREYFAGLAMQGFCSNKSILMPNNKIEPEELLASMSITIADELLKQLEEK